MYHRKYAIEKLRGYVRGAPPLKREGHRGHPKEYDAGVLEILEKVWEAADYPWSVRLKEILRVWLPAIKKHFPMTPEIEKKLSAISPSTIDRAFKTKKRSLKRRVYGRIKPGTLLKHQIPIKTDCWDVKLRVLVKRCGNLFCPPNENHAAFFTSLSSIFSFSITPSLNFFPDSTA